MTDSLATALGRMIFSDDYFRKLFVELEDRYAASFISTHDAESRTVVGGGKRIDEKTVSDALRYADILSHSSISEHRAAAYNSISLLRELSNVNLLAEETEARVSAVAEAVLVELGNFPGLSTLHRTDDATTLPLEREVTRATKQVVQRTQHSESVFTDAQYDIVRAMRQKDFFSFSGPTSLGKSFIIKDALVDLVSRPEMNGGAIVLLVPTKALIGQAAADLRNLFSEIPDVNVATFPTLPPYLQKKFSKTVFVLTPERLLSYLSRPVRDVQYLFVDEAQKIISENDARSSLYYHAIAETIRLFATKLIFASPNIENPELFLRLFQKSTNGALAVTDRTVSQQRFLIDFIDKEAWFYHMLEPTPSKLDFGTLPESVNETIRALSGPTKSIIYVNSSAQSAELAVDFSKSLPLVDDPRIDALIAFAESYIHRDYYLVESLKRGVAFHHGKMPQEVRERVEACFAALDSPLQYIFCTSTLLEGVNLPAKNIFVLTDQSGTHGFSRIDFENLVGRAGRLRFDFSGNVICIRDKETRWVTKTRDLIGNREPYKASSFIVELPGKRKKEYTYIAQALTGSPITGSHSADALRNIQQYASIVTLHQLDGNSSPLRDNFLEKVEGGRDVLKRAGSAVEIPLDILRKVPDIRVVRQNAVRSEILELGDGAALIPVGADLNDVQTFQTALAKLYRVYAWDVEESKGNDPLIHSSTVKNGTVDSRLWYWAILMRNWVRGDPLSRVVGEAISYHRQQKQITYRSFAKSNGYVTEAFDVKSSFHINLVIEDTFKALEHGLRFRILRYVQNYSDIYSQTYGGAVSSGLDVAALLEYGTTDRRVIELQDVGFTRSTAIALMRDHAEFISFDENGYLKDIDAPTIISKLDDEIVRNEVRNVTQLVVA